MIKSVFFDLDGTLADSAPDLAAALNQLRREHDKADLPYKQIRPVVSQGGDAMILLGFDVDPESDVFASLRQRFLQIYEQLLHNGTSLFPEMESVLDQLEREGLTWGVVTNKPSWLTNPLMQKLRLETRAGCIVSGDSTEYKKPHPAPMLYACEISNSRPETSVYVGDARRDIDAGRAAGMYTIVADYGYISDDENSTDWRADAHISHPLELMDWIRQQNRA
ncbi:MAG TPA: phosphoglycolate phosphatase [Gammaproteobacteria bacterium]|nr:phosphoglycolate phosphatase [Gammaproteobacteria bacterium]